MRPAGARQSGAVVPSSSTVSIGATVPPHVWGRLAVSAIGLSPIDASKMVSFFHAWECPRVSFTAFFIIYRFRRLAMTRVRD